MTTSAPRQARISHLFGALLTIASPETNLCGAFMQAPFAGARTHVHSSQLQAKRDGYSGKQPLDKGFNLLELAGGVVPQGLIVSTAKEGWKFAWQRMMAELAPQDKTGGYQRPSYGFKSTDLNALSATTDMNRYHLYLGNPCPWCHRAKIALKVLKIPQEVVGETMLEDNPTKASRGGWVFSAAQPDPLGHSDLRQLYDALAEGGSYKGRCTAPLLIDKKARVIISNESSDIVRLLNQKAKSMMLPSNGNDSSSGIDLYPTDLAQAIDETNQWIYQLLNNGVYRCGFSTRQAQYDLASKQVRQGLERAESILQNEPFLCGGVFSEADLRLLPTILRFDGAYAPLFKAGGTFLRIRSDYPAVHSWLKRCWAIPGVPESIDLADACSSYYKQLFPLNPGGILPTPVTAKDLGLE